MESISIRPLQHSDLLNTEKANNLIGFLRALQETASD